MQKDKTLKEVVKEVYGMTPPISGGWGDSIDDAIKIDINEYDIAIDMQHQLNNLRFKMIGEDYKFVRSQLMQQNGRTYDKMQYIFASDPDNYHNIYFDVTDYKYPGDK